jgi:hypothetical protein
VKLTLLARSVTESINVPSRSKMMALIFDIIIFG